MDGYIGKKRAQIKFKWIDNNWNDRYVEINPEHEFDLLIVIYAEHGDSEVSFFGQWGLAEIKSKINPSNNRLYLKHLETIPQYAIGDE